MLSIESEIELLAMHRVLYEARFNTKIDDIEIAGSATLADLHSRVVAELLKFEAVRGQTTIKEWLNGDHTAEVKIARHWIKKIGIRWEQISLNTKHEYISCLLKPLNFNESVLNELIAFGDNENGNRNRIL